MHDNNIVKKLVRKFMALAKINIKIYRSFKFFCFYTHILNEYAEEKGKEKNTSDWSAFHGVSITKEKSEYSFGVNLT